MGHAAIMHEAGYLGKVKFIVYQEFFHPLYFVCYDEFFNRDTLHFRKKIGKVSVVVV